MRYALNPLGAEVSASETQFVSTGFTCAVCKSPVFLRRGAIRAPHFAHYGFSAKAECLLYNGSQALSRGPSDNQYAEAVDSERSTWPFSSVVYFLGVSEEERAGLSLRLPPMPGFADQVPGEILLHTGFGLRIIRAEVLGRAHAIEVLPAVPGVEISGTDSLVELGQLLAAQSAQLAAGVNTFHIGEPRGRQLRALEPVEWGGSYRVLTDGLPQMPAVLNPHQVVTGWSEKWSVYEVHVPSEIDIDDDSQRISLREFFGRSIVPPRPRAYFVDPLPHHFELDGACVFPEQVSEILVRAPETCECWLQYLTGVRVSGKRIGGGWVKFTGLAPGDFVVRLGSDVGPLGRLGVCEFFRPGGIVVTAPDVSAALESSALAAIASTSPSEKWSIYCPSDRVAAIVRFQGIDWVRDGNEFKGDVTSLRLFDADAFGVLRPAARPIDLQSESTNERKLQTARSRWLVGVAEACHGVRGRQRIHDGGWSSMEFSDPGDSMDYLMPHLRAEKRGDQ